MNEEPKISPIINEYVSPDWLHDPNHAVWPAHSGERQGWTCAQCKISNLGPTREVHIMMTLVHIQMSRWATRNFFGAN